MNFYKLDDKDDYSMHLGAKKAMDIINSDKDHKEIEKDLLDYVMDFSQNELYNILTKYYNLSSKALKVIETRFILTADDKLLKKYFNNFNKTSLRKYLSFVLNSFPNFVMNLLTQKKLNREGFLSECFDEEELIEYIFNNSTKINSSVKIKEKRLKNICILYARGYYDNYERGLTEIINSKNPIYILKFAETCQSHIDLSMVAKTLEEIKDLNTLYNFAIKFKNIDTKNIAKILFDSKEPLYILLSSIYLDNTLLNNFNSVEDIFLLISSIENKALAESLIKKLSGILANNTNKSVDSIVESLFEESNPKKLA